MSVQQTNTEYKEEYVNNQTDEYKNRKGTYSLKGRQESHVVCRDINISFQSGRKRGKARQERSTVEQSLDQGMKLQEQWYIKGLVPRQGQCKAQYT